MEDKTVLNYATPIPLQRSQILLTLAMRIMIGAAAVCAANVALDATFLGDPDIVLGVADIVAYGMAALVGLGFLSAIAGAAVCVRTCKTEARFLLLVLYLGTMLLNSFVVVIVLLIANAGGG